MTDMIDSLSDVDYEMGLDFHWGVWTPDTTLTLVNVPWTNDYRDIWRAPNGHTDLDAWIDSHPNLIIHNMSYLPFQSSVRIDTPFNAAQKYNYVRASNPLQPGVIGDIQENYYYFILGVNYIAPGTTELILQLDIWQTFGYQVTFGSCYVERGHIGIANTNMSDQYGRSYLTVPEGLDVGGEYRTVHVESEKIMDNPDVGGNYNILVVSTVDLTQDPGNFGTNDNPQVVSAKGTQFMGLPSGADIYIFGSVDGMKGWLTAYQNKPWITSCILSMTVIPALRRYYNNVDLSTNISPDGHYIYKWVETRPSRKDVKLSTNWRANDTFINNILGSRYSMLRKFLTYPYMILELTTWTGSPLVIKPEMWQDADATISELPTFFPTGQRIAIMPREYNSDAETNNPGSENSAELMANDDGGEFLDFAAILENFPQIPIVNNMSVAYIANNMHSIGFQFRAADWGQQRARAGAQAGADVANAQIRNTGRQSGIANTAQVGQLQNSINATIQHSVLGGVGDLAKGSAKGSVAGAAGGAAKAGMSMIDAAVGMNAQINSVDIATGARGAAAVSNIQTAGQVRDTNQAYANFAAKGDYQNEIAGINAKIQDSAMTQPSTSGQFGGEALNLSNDLVGYSLRWKMLNLSTLRRIGDIWLRYGYAIDQFLTMPATLQVMTKFTYWKLSETYIATAGMPESFKQTIRGIFEKGVTVWNSPDDIGRIDWSDNTPLPNISY